MLPDLLNSIQLSLIDLPAGGLADLWDTVKNDWLGPIFLAAVAVFAIVFIKDRAWLKLISFIGIAAVVGLLIFASEDLFGSEDATFTGVAKDASEEINTISANHIPLEELTVDDLTSK